MGRRRESLGQISPLLFPIVGRQIGDFYSYNGKSYRLLAKRGIPDNSVITERTGFTNAYIKPMKFVFSGEEVESARLDFENELPISPKVSQSCAKRRRALTYSSSATSSRTE